MPWHSNAAVAVNGPWFAGAVLQARSCDGDCSHETFRLYRSDQHYFGFCKTACKPYDIAVTAALIIVKHYVRDIHVSSD